MFSIKANQVSGSLGTYSHNVAINPDDTKGMGNVVILVLHHDFRHASSRYIICTRVPEKAEDKAFEYK